VWWHAIGSKTLCFSDAFDKLRRWILILLQLATFDDLLLHSWCAIPQLSSSTHINIIDLDEFFHIFVACRTYISQRLPYGIGRSIVRTTDSSTPGANPRQQQGRNIISSF
jgi:hypothetical protein